MSSVIRYTSYTNAEAIAATDLVGTEIALQAVRVVLPAIAATANANIFTLKGAGTIKSVMSCLNLKVDGSVRLEDVTGFNRALKITISADGRSVVFTLPANAQAVSAGDLAYLLLAIGY